MQILEYIIYGIGVLFALGWGFNIRSKARGEQATSKMHETFGMLMVVSLILIPVFSWSPLHLLWMFPLAFLLGLLSMMPPFKILWPLASIYGSLWYIGISNEGIKYYVAGDYSKAIEALTEEVGKNPSSAEAYFYLGLAYGKINQHDQEIASYKKAIEIKPKKPELHLNLGFAYNDTGNKQEAISEIKEAILLRPDYLNAHYKLCQIYIEMGDVENAKREFETLSKIDSNRANELAPSIKAM